MPRRHAPFLSLALAVLLAANRVDADTARHASLPYRQLFELATTFAKLPVHERDRLTLRHRLLPARSDTRLWFDYQGQRIDIPVAADGSFELPGQELPADANPLVQSNLPQGSAQLDVGLLVRLPDARRFRYADLTRATDQMSRLVRRQAGLLGLFMPQIDTLVFQCAAPHSACELTLHLLDGERRHAPDAQGRIRLRLDAELRRLNPELSARQAFAEIRPDLD